MLLCCDCLSCDRSRCDVPVWRCLAVCVSGGVVVLFVLLIVLLLSLALLLFVLLVVNFV